MDIGALMTKFRREARLTIEELSAKSGVPKGTVTKILSGQTRSPTLEVVLALAHACGRTLADFDHSFTTLSAAAISLAMDYDALDAHGRSVLRGLCAEEKQRMAEEERLAALSPEGESRVINLFSEPSAAGFALGEVGQSATPYTLRPDDPPGASYAVRLTGDSMEPWFHDGEIVFVNHDAMRSGDVGIFAVDGATVCKQWHYDQTLGITYLFSLNRARSDADIVVTRGSGRSVVWQGRVITRRRFDLPGL